MPGGSEPSLGQEEQEVLSILLKKVGEGKTRSITTRYSNLRWSYPEVATWGFRHLTAPASSSCVERLFSHVKLVHSERRRRLKAGALPKPACLTPVFRSEELVVSKNGGRRLSVLAVTLRYAAADNLTRVVRVVLNCKRQAREQEEEQLKAIREARMRFPLGSGGSIGASSDRAGDLAGAGASFAAHAFHVAARAKDADDVHSVGDEDGWAEIDESDFSSEDGSADGIDE